MDDQTNQPIDADILSALNTANLNIDAMRGEMAKQGEKIDAAFVYGHRNRAMIWGIIASVVFDIALSVVLYVTIHRVDHVAQVARRASSSAVTNRNNLRVQCESGNDYRVGERALWTSVLQLSDEPRPDETPAQIAFQKAQREKFLPILDKQYALRDCAKLYPPLRGDD